jgi:cell division protein FtsL
MDADFLSVALLIGVIFMAIDLSKLTAAIEALKAERDKLKSELAAMQAVTASAADQRAADQAAVDALAATAV